MKNEKMVSTCRTVVGYIVTILGLCAALSALIIAYVYDTPEGCQTSSEIKITDKSLLKGFAIYKIVGYCLVLACLTPCAIFLIWLLFIYVLFDIIVTLGLFIGSLVKVLGVYNMCLTQGSPIDITLLVFACLSIIFTFLTTFSVNFKKIRNK